jgi:polyisoprenoid-binding protein YceI
LNYLRQNYLNLATHNVGLTQVAGQITLALGPLASFYPVFTGASGTVVTLYKEPLGKTNLAILLFNSLPMRLRHLLILPLGWLGLSCAQAPDSHQAEVHPTTMESPPPPSPQAVSYAVDTVRSQVIWVGTKPSGQHHGTFQVSQGHLLVEANQVVGGRLAIAIRTMKVANIEATSPDHAKFIKHLMSQDFFAADQHPLAHFELLRVEPFVAATEAGPPTDPNPALPSAQLTHSITGNLTLKDLTKTITFPAKVEVKDGQLTAEANFNIDRTVWKMNYRAEGDLGDNLISRTVNLGFLLKASQPTIGN